MSSGIDLDAYFDRIGYAGSRAPTLDTLCALHELHPQAIAFENLDPFLRRPVRLDARAIEDKLIHGHRGGYCFEHNLLFLHVLKGLGFRVKGLAARLLWRRPEHTITPLEHMLLLVDVGDKPHIADVGFGGMTVTAPLRLEPAVVQATPHEPFRLILAGEAFILQAQIRDTWQSFYRFDLHEQLQPDYEVANWYQSTYPESQFVTHLIAARTSSGRRYALRNNELAVHQLGGATERRKLHTLAELRSTLAETFGLDLRNMRELDAALGSLTEAAAVVPSL